MCHIFDSVLFKELYENASLTPQIEKMFRQLQEKVNKEVENIKLLMELEGIVHMLLSSNATQSTRPSIATGGRDANSKGMVPSAAAKASANVVYNVA